MKISELLEKKSPTIMSATTGNKGLNRNKIDPMVDPRGYFAKNKRSHKKSNATFDKGN